MIFRKVNYFKLEKLIILIYFSINFIFINYEYINLYLSYFIFFKFFLIFFINNNLYI